MGKQSRVGAAAVGGLLALAVVAGACSTGNTSGLEVTSGVVPDPTTVPATPAVVTTTAAPGPAPVTSRRATTPRTGRSTTRPGAPATAASGLSLADTGLTRVRVTIENQAQWATLTLHGTEIKAARVVEASGGTRVTSLGPDLGVAEPGRAVIELVLRIPKDARPSVSMCKNIHGPATVTITRLTDAPASIATLTNYASESRTHERCEGYATGELSRPALIGPVRWPARNDARPLVLANYYPWYDDASLNHNYGDQPTGPAHTGNAATVASAIGLAASSGIDGFIVEYEGTPAWDPHIDAVYRAASARPGFNAALMIDFEILDARHGAITGQILDAALTAVAQRATQPSQLEVGGQPVVFLFGSHLVRPSEWASALTRLRGNTGLRPFVIGDGAWLGAPGQHVYSTNNCPDLARLLQWAAGTLIDFRAKPGLVGDAGPLWVAPVSPGYDDRRLDRPSHRYVERRGGARYDESWSAALDTLPDWVIVTSWNEYSEQTHVMPGNATGTVALDQTAAWAARFHATG